MNKIYDSLESHHVTCFRNIKRFKEELKFALKDNIVTFENNFQKKI